MKKIIGLITVLLLFVAGMSAQDFTIHKPGVTQIVTNDTIANTGTDDVVVKFAVPSGSANAFNYAMQMTATTISGTPAIVPQLAYSVDGTNYVNIANVASDTLVAAQGLSNIKVDGDGFYCPYLRVTYTGYGTQSTKVNAYLYVLLYKQ